MHKADEFYELVEKLNGDLGERNPTGEFAIEYTTSGNVDTISFEGNVLWENQNHPTNLNLNQMYDYIRREFNKYAYRVMSLRFKDVPRDPEVYKEQMELILEHIHEFPKARIAIMAPRQDQAHSLLSQLIELDPELVKKYSITRGRADYKCGAEIWASDNASAFFMGGANWSLVWVIKKSGSPASHAEMRARMGLRLGPSQILITEEDND